MKQLNFNTPTPGVAARTFTALRRTTGTALLAGSIFTGIAPAVDGLGASQAQTIIKAGKVSYDPAAHPFTPNEAMSRLVGSILKPRGDAKFKIMALFDSLKVGAPNGMKVVSSEGRPPRTAMEAWEKGGDCTELANVWLAAIGCMLTADGVSAPLIKSEVQVVHFNGTPENKQHMIAWMEIEGKRVAVDLQAQQLGGMKNADYTVIRTMVPANAVTVYHQEMGDYFSDRKMHAEAITAYEKAVEICRENTDAHKGAAANYERLGRWDMALVHYLAAAKLDPAYANDTLRAGYYLHYTNAEKAAEAGNWGICADCFKAARGILDLHTVFPSKAEMQERKDVENGLGACSRNAEKVKNSGQ